MLSHLKIGQKLFLSFCPTLFKVRRKKEREETGSVAGHAWAPHSTLVFGMAQAPHYFGIWYGNYGTGSTHYSTVGLSKLLKWSIVPTIRQLFQILQNLCQNFDEPKLHNYTKCMRQQQAVAQCSNNNYFRFRAEQNCHGRVES